MDEMDEIVQEFLIESAENLDQLDRDLLTLEAEPESREALASAFRTIHTIKGTSGFLAYRRLEELTHVGESLLSRLRDGHQRMDTATADVLLQMVDTVRAILSGIEANGTDTSVDIAGLVQSIRLRITSAGNATEDATVSSPAVAEPADSIAPTEEEAVLPPANPTAADRPTGQESAQPCGAGDPGEPAPTAPGCAAAPAPRRSASDSSLRVDVDLLDTLMRLAGELVLTRNQVLRGLADLGDPALSRTAQRLNAITTEMQESIMKTRMQPIEQVWSKLPRVVRDLGAQCGRQVRLTMTGQDTELDRALLEAIKDPLTHLVRNAVDHGIEPAQDRVAAGKPAEGVLSLLAYHNSGQVVIEVRDDGAGIAADRIAAKAVERGLRTADQVAAMRPNDLLNLIFEAGFSTADTVTNVSGRGVGMDVVKTNIEAIGGTIDIECTPGEGTVCRMRVPLTLAIVPALTVECAGDRYAVAQSSLLELVALDPAKAGTQIEQVAGVPVYRLRGALLPLIALREVLTDPANAGTSEPGFSDLATADTDSAASQVIAVLQAGTRRFGLLVDRVVNTEEIVVKALSARLKSVGVYSGATILGDGRVALILDVQNLARRALQTDPTDPAANAVTSPDGHRAGDGETERLLIAGLGDGRKVAIPMSMIARLETIPSGNVETIGNREAVQYRDGIIPLIRLDQHLGVPTAQQPSDLPVAVYSNNTHSAAIAMDSIIDIVDHVRADQSPVDDRGFVGSVIVHDQIVGLLDVEEAILTADPNFFTSTPAGAAR